MNEFKREAKKILVVEDTEIVRQSILWLLQQEGYIVYTATDGTDALDTLKEWHFDLILMDFNMPKMDGISLTTALRKNFQFRKPIIGMSGGIDLHSKLKWFEAGMTAFVDKPFESRELLDVLRH